MIFSYIITISHHEWFHILFSMIKYENYKNNENVKGLKMLNG